MTRYLKWLPRLAEILAGALLAAIFATFLLQIGSRYLPKVISGLGLSDTLPMLASVEPLAGRWN
ncbi:hypothetical protein [Sulfitobacter sediminilitoris]|uniref:hypothetical protein n=1 Tax=Sulfitobacter sediminilitoris TaxID=2698830 RepID=UPI00361AE504